MKSYLLFQSCSKYNIGYSCIGKFTDINNAHTYLNDWEKNNQCISCIFQIKEEYASVDNKSFIPSATSQGKSKCCIDHSYSNHQKDIPSFNDLPSKYYDHDRNSGLIDRLFSKLIFYLTKNK